MILILVRHGEANGEGDSPLSTKGKKQAKCVAKRLSKLKITKAYTSDYLRAKETFDAYHLLNKKVRYECTPELREIYRAIVGGPIKEGTRPTRADEDKKRADTAFEKLLQAKKDDVIVVFAHGNLIRYYLAKTLGVDPQTMWNGILINNCSLSVIQKENDIFTVKSINNIEHLPKEDVAHFYEKAESTKYLP